MSLGPMPGSLNMKVLAHSVSDLSTVFGTRYRDRESTALLLFHRLLKVHVEH